MESSYLIVDNGENGAERHRGKQTMVLGDDYGYLAYGDCISFYIKYTKICRNEYSQIGY